MTFGFPPEHAIGGGSGRDGMPLGKPTSVNGNTGGINGNANGLLSSQYPLNHHQTYHRQPPSSNTKPYSLTSSSSTPTFPGLTEDYEPSSSGRSSNDTPVILHSAAFPPTIVDLPNDNSSPGIYPSLSEDTKGLGYGHGLPQAAYGRTNVLGDGTLSVDPGSVSKDVEQANGGPFKIFGIDIKWIS
jgi:hypothetical protein